MEGVTSMISSQTMNSEQEFDIRIHTQLSSQHITRRKNITARFVSPPSFLPLSVLFAPGLSPRPVPMPCFRQSTEGHGAEPVATSPPHFSSLSCSLHLLQSLCLSRRQELVRAEHAVNNPQFLARLHVRRLQQLQIFREFAGQPLLDM